jgi:hypothetical protein
MDGDMSSILCQKVVDRVRLGPYKKSYTFSYSKLTLSEPDLSIETCASRKPLTVRSTIGQNWKREKNLALYFMVNHRFLVGSHKRAKLKGGWCSLTDGKSAVLLVDFGKETDGIRINLHSGLPGKAPFDGSAQIIQTMMQSTRTVTIPLKIGTVLVFSAHCLSHRGSHDTIDFDRRS